MAYDNGRKVAYLVGGKNLYVVGLDTLVTNGTLTATPKDLPLLQTMPLPTTLTDVAFCGGYLAISAEGATKVSPGIVMIFNRYGDSILGNKVWATSLEQLANFTVGELVERVLLGHTPLRRVFSAGLNVPCFDTGTAAALIGETVLAASSSVALATRTCSSSLACVRQTPARVFPAGLLVPYSL